MPNPPPYYLTTSLPAMLNPPSQIAPVIGTLPQWATELVTAYESASANQFVLYGNVHDRLVLPIGQGELGGLTDFLLRVLMPRFDVIVSYDIGNGIRIEKGGETFTQWPAYK